MDEGVGGVVRLFKRYAVIIIGFALFCSLLRQPYFGNVISAQLLDAHNVRAVLDGFIMVVAVAVAVIGTRTDGGRATRWLSLMSVVLLALGVGTFAVMRLSNLDGWPSFIGAFLCAIGFMLLAFLWVRLLGLVDRDDVVPVAALSFTISLFVGFADIVDGPAKDVINVMIPACSEFCVTRAAKVPQVDDAERQSSGGIPLLYALIVVAIAIEVLCCSLVRGTWNSGGIGYAGMNFYRMMSYLVSALIGILFFAIALFAKRPERSGVVIGVVSLLGILILIIALAAFGSRIAASFVTSLYSALLVVLFAVLAAAARNGFLAHSVAAGVFCAVFGGISLVSYTVIPSLSAYNRAGSAEYLLPVALAAALVIVVGEFAIIAIRVHAQAKASRSPSGEPTRESIWDSISVQQDVTINGTLEADDDPLETLVGKAAERYHLTAREADIVKLLAQGYTIKNAAEELYLAPSTVQGYTKSIYAKLGIHGKSEIKNVLASL